MAESVTKQKSVYNNEEIVTTKKVLESLNHICLASEQRNCDDLLICSGRKSECIDCSRTFISRYRSLLLLSLSLFLSLTHSFTLRRRVNKDKVCVECPLSNTHAQLLRCSLLFHHPSCFCSTLQLPPDQNPSLFFPLF